MSPPPTVAIVEPHYDDAWLSLGGTMLTHPEVGFFVLSVSRDVGNADHHTRRLEDALPNLTTCDLALRDLGWNRREVGRRRKEAGVEDWRALFDLENDLGPDALEALIRSALPDTISALCLPLGLVHPMHDVVSKLELGVPTLHYFEYPYGYFRGWEAALEERTHGRRERRVDVARVVAEKRRLFEATYPEQRAVLTIPRCTTSLSDMTEERLYGDARLAPSSGAMR